MARNSRFSRILLVLAFLGSIASFSAGCLCAEMRSAPSGVSGAAARPAMSCHVPQSQDGGGRLLARCCCEMSPGAPSAVDPHRASTLPERWNAAVAESAMVPTARLPRFEGHGDLGGHRIDRAPPPSFKNPLRI